MLEKYFTFIISLLIGCTVGFVAFITECWVISGYNYQQAFYDIGIKLGLPNGNGLDVPWDVWWVDAFVWPLLLANVIIVFLIVYKILK